jgi:hypothetical protein
MKHLPMRCKSAAGSPAILADIRPRTHRATRHDPANGIMLCRRHHQFFHDRPKEFAAFVAMYLPRP